MVVQSPEIAVVVPTFRRPTLVVEAVRSALSQDGVSVEVLVADDSPEGSARPAIEGLNDPRVTFQHRTVFTDSRPAVVRNDAVRETRAPVVHFLDDDDRVAPGAYRAVLDALAAHPDRGVVFGGVEPFGDDPAAVKREQGFFTTARRRARLFQRFDSRCALIANELYVSPTLFVNSACFIRREHILALGGYDPDLEVMEDVEFFTRAIRRFGFIYLDRVVAEYRTGHPSLMNKKTDAQRVDAAYLRIYTRYRSNYGQLELRALQLLAKGVIRWF